MHARIIVLATAAITSSWLVACSASSGETTEPAPAPVSSTEEQPDPPRSAFGNGRVTGLLRAPANANPMPEGSKIQVTVWEADASMDSKRIMNHEVEITGPAPWAFEVTLDEAGFEPMNGYGISAMVVDADGVAWFMTQPKSIKIADDPDASVELSLDPADPRAVTE